MRADAGVSVTVDFSEAFLPEELGVWEPPERLTVSEWADKYRVLDAAVSPEPGPWRTDRTPYARAWIDAFNDPEIEIVVIQTATQVAKTETLLNIIGYIVDQRPGPCMVVYPTVETAEDISRTRVQPMIGGHERLKAKKRGDRHLFTTLRMAFLGMDLFLSGANSAASLASKPCEFILLDEVNKYPRVVGDEADPISLAIERTKNFPWSRKVIMASTPTTDSGRITMELEDCDLVCHFHVPCPHCGEYRPLRFDQVKWPQIDKEDPERFRRIEEEAHYVCPVCGGVILDHHKGGMLQAGEWVADRDFRRKKKIGFQLSSLYSPWVKFGQMAVEFIKAKPYPEKLQNFVNAWLGEPWKEVVLAGSRSRIHKARTPLAPQTVPPEAVALTAAVDCQKYGFWFVVRAWARDFTSWRVHFGRLSTWEDVEELLFATSYPVAGGDRVMRIFRAAVDTGGGDRDEGMSMTEEAYAWLRRNGVGRGCRVWGTKGASSPLSGKIHLGKPLDKTPSGRPIPGGLQIVLLDTEKLKDAFHYRLQLAINGQAGGAYLDSGTAEDETYVSHILAEEKRRDRRGVERWERVRKRNDLLDCECMNLALADPEWPGGGVHLIRAVSAPEVSGGAGGGKGIRIARSRWMGG